MIAIATLWDAVIAVAVVLAVLVLALAVLSRRGRRVHLSVDVGNREDEPDEPEDSVTDQ